jgi:hypothetical protein
MAPYYLTAVALALLLVPVGGLRAQHSYTEHTLTRSEGALPPTASVEDVAWIAGHWRGEALGGIAEEVWSPPLGGTMMGMFKLIRQGEIAFYEILTIAPEGESIVLTLKHFHADLTGWEEKNETVRFPLVKLTPEAAYFDTMTFRRIARDTLQIFLAVRQPDGSVHEAEFLYRRVPQASTP